MVMSGRLSFRCGRIELSHTIYCVSTIILPNICESNLLIAVERLKRRLDDVGARGVVIAPGQTIEGLFAERRPLYLRYADTTIATDGLTPDQVVGSVLQFLATS